MTRVSYERTNSGLFYMMFGFIMFAVMSFITGLSYYSWSQDPMNDPSSLICFPSLLGIAGGILFIIGIYKIYKDAPTISSDHKFNVKVAIVLVIIGFILSQISSQISLLGGTTANLRNSFLIRGTLNFFSNLAYGIMPIILVYKITDKKIKKYLYLGGGVLIISSLFLLVYYTIGLGSIDSVKQLALQALEMTSIVLMFRSIGYLFFGIGYRKIEVVPDDLRKDRSTTSQNDFGTLGKRKMCPECKTKEMRVSLDGSGYCEYCGYSTRNYQQEKESNDKMKS